MLIGSFIFIHSGKASCQSGGTLTIRFEDIESGKGYIRLALYRDSEDFLDIEKAVLYNFKIDSTGVFEAKIEGISPGTYAFASFHDEDGDEKLSTNFFGIPKEPYCFSRPSPSKWRPPSFDEAKFELKEEKSQLTVSMQRWQF